jgi:hypothetical protein
VEDRGESVVGGTTFIAAKNMPHFLIYLAGLVA